MNKKIIKAAGVVAVLGAVYGAGVLTPASNSQAQYAKVSPSVMRVSETKSHTVNVDAVAQRIQDEEYRCSQTVKSFTDVLDQARAVGIIPSIEVPLVDYSAVKARIAPSMQPQ